MFTPQLGKWLNNQRLVLLTWILIRPKSQITQCTFAVFHNAVFRIEMCTFLFWMLWDWSEIGVIHPLFCVGCNYLSKPRFQWGVYICKIAIKTHCGLVTPFGVRYLSQHWFRWWLVAWRHQSITWPNVDLSSVKSRDIHLRANSRSTPQLSTTEINVENYLSKISFKSPRGQLNMRGVSAALLLIQWPRISQRCNN